MAPGWPMRAAEDPGRPKRLPRGTQEAPKMDQEGIKRAHEEAGRAPESDKNEATRGPSQGHEVCPPISLFAIVRKYRHDQFKVDFAPVCDRQV